MAENILTKTYRPSLTVGQVYARPYGSTAAPTPIGNVLELDLEHDEDVQKQDDMTRMGGGVHAEVRRIKDITIKMKLADLNVVNLTRAVLGTAQAITGGTVTGEELTVTLGGLLRLAHLAPTAQTLKKGVDAATATALTVVGNVEIRPEGIYVLPEAKDLSNGDTLWVDYTYGEYAVIEALTTKAPELELTFGGLNEADSGKPTLVEVWRVSQSVTKKLMLLGKDFGAIEVDGTVLQDPTKTGAGISRYYRTSVV